MLEEIVKECLKRGKITQIVGPPKSGKNTMIYHLARKVQKGKKAIIVDAEMSISIERMKQLTKADENKLERILIIQVKNKEEQQKTILNLHNMVKKEQIKFIAINGITNHIRNTKKNESNVNGYNVLALEVAYLKELANKTKIPIIITNQMRMEKKKEEAVMEAVGKKIFERYVDETFKMTQINEKLWAMENNEKRKSLYTITKNGITIIE